MDWRGWLKREGTRWARGASRASGLSLLVACSGSADGPAPQVDGEWAARTGIVTLEPSVVEVGIAGDPDGRAAVANFALANALRTAEPGSAAWLRRLALAHALADDLARAAEARGATSDAELASWTAAPWLEVDRPTAFRTVHAVVLDDPKATETERAAARELAERIRVAVLDATNLAEFRTKAAGVAAGGATVKVEELDPVAADGRVVRLGTAVGAPVSTYDEAFAKAASSLGRIGETSPVVTSSFGHHVLRLEEIIPELRVPAEQRRLLAARDVLDMRARTELNDLLTAARSREAVGVERSAEEATARVSVE